MAKLSSRIFCQMSAHLFIPQSAVNDVIQPNRIWTRATDWLKRRHQPSSDVNKSSRLIIPGKSRENSLTCDVWGNNSKRTEKLIFDRYTHGSMYLDINVDLDLNSYLFYICILYPSSNCLSTARNCMEIFFFCDLNVRIGSKAKFPDQIYPNFSFNR